ncbi:hypothetical protein CRM22_003354 [Opisthorchis felineus]|uniref:Uncharacterized protein n=1 Tax=Opisthorchis felineus TaxID=147828 RepID=A0A4S2M278_OPIFE|nr:hypothetical protein CRM22_003354 [Opisthorchis felineus]
MVVRVFTVSETMGILESPTTQQHASWTDAAVASVESDALRHTHSNNRASDFTKTYSRTSNPHVRRKVSLFDFIHNSTLQLIINLFFDKTVKWRTGCKRYTNPMVLVGEYLDPIMIAFECVNNCVAAIATKTRIRGDHLE